MRDLIPKNTDQEMERYMEAEMIRQARIPLENNAALVYEADPITKRENALFPLSSGGYVKIGERAQTPAQAAETDVLAAAQTIQNSEGVPISEIIGGANGPTLDDYEAAGFTEAQVREYQAQVQAEALSEPGVMLPNVLTEEQMQFGEQVGAPMISPRDLTMREGATATLAGTGDNASSRFLRDIYEAIGLDEFEARRLAEAVMGNPNATRDWGIGLTDLTPAGMVFGAEEGFNTFQRGLNSDDPVTAGLGALEAGLSVLEAVPLTAVATRGLSEAASPAMREAINALRSDAIGVGRAVMQGDREMLGEVFQRSGTPRPLGADATRTDDAVMQETQDFLDQVSAPDPEAATAITAFHGSPYDFDAFDISRIGTGEGAQAYGPGLYFAEAEDVARGYRDSLSARAAPNDARGNAFDLVQRMGGDVDATIEVVRDGVENATSPNTQEFLRETLRHLEDGTYADFERPLGRLYEVNIRANPEEFLNWDAPISQQSETVREALMPFVERRIEQMGEAGNRFTTEQWINRLRGGDVMLLDRDGDNPVSEALIEAGVPGVRYLDQASRGTGQGTRNYVVFDDQLIDIVRRYGVAGLAIGAAVQSELGVNEQFEGDT